MQNKENIPRDKSFVDFVRQVLYTWGTKAKVVKRPATYPIMGIKMSNGEMVFSHYKTSRKKFKSELIYE